MLSPISPLPQHVINSKMSVSSTLTGTRTVHKCIIKELSLHQLYYLYVPTEKQVLTVYDLLEASERLKWLPEDQMKLAGTTHQDWSEGCSSLKITTSDVWSPVSRRRSHWWKPKRFSALEVQHSEALGWEQSLTNGRGVDTALDIQTCSPYHLISTQVRGPEKTAFYLDGFEIALGSTSRWRESQRKLDLLVPPWLVRGWMLYARGTRNPHLTSRRELGTASWTMKRIIT